MAAGSCTTQLLRRAGNGRWSPINAKLEHSPETSKVMQLAADAGEVLKKYHNTRLEADYKTDRFDPVSIADREADALLRRGIAKAFPSDQILSEENPTQPDSYTRRVWMVDPLDDSKGYLAGRDTAGVMIGLLENGRPRLGVVYLPFRDEWYFGQAGEGSFRKRNGQIIRLQVNRTQNVAEAVLVGRNVVEGDIRPIDEAIAQLDFKRNIPEGCIGAKIGLIAAGEADAFIHTNLKAGKWDTLAAEVILNEAGGVMADIDGQSLDYTKSDSAWGRYFLAASTPELLEVIVSRLANINSEAHIF